MQEQIGEPETAKTTQGAQRFRRAGEPVRAPRFTPGPSAQRAAEDREQRRRERAIASWLRSLVREA